MTHRPSLHLTRQAAFCLVLLFLCFACARQQPAQPSGAKGFSLQPHEAGQRIDVLVDGKLFTSYRYPSDLYKPVLNPVIAANGRPVTRGWPYEPRAGERTDHPHQVGMWLNYGDVNGLDFWNNSNARKPEEKHRYGTIRHHQVTGMRQSGKQAELEVSMNWLRPDSVVLLREDTRFVFSGSGNTRIIDRITTLTAQQQDVFLNDNKEGFFAIRVARELEHPLAKPAKYTDSGGKEIDLQQGDPAITGRYYSSRGIEGEDVWGTRAEWVALKGAIGGEPVSLTIMDHPQNVGFPTYWMARGYGLFSANPLGQKVLSDGKEELNYKLLAGNAVTFTYRLLIVSGEEQNTGQTTAAFKAFSDTYRK
ncbi:DUF6807 domain-containing protein [Pontibacter beigongshangensis]|uniref:DUF6807 domain-containing protein n=1 Tax=Pontibacter beigongshangensis TaxID=2574733 RepID=UPI00164F06F2|nr:PmoA family protein [Pontibacter beigongshangensis]